MILDDDINDFLEHFGVRGMKWGQRKAPRNTVYGKQTRGLSEKELNRRIDRMELERHYRELNTPQRSAGRDYTNSLIAASGTAIVTAGLGAVAGFFVQRALGRRFS